MKEIALKFFGIFLGLLFISYVWPDADSKSFDCTVLYTMNIEGGVLAKQSKIASLPYLASAIKSVREEASQNNGVVILADLGNALYGSDLAYFSRGEIMTRIMNRLEYNYVIPGPKEFQYGPEMLRLWTYQSNFECLASNIECINLGETFPKFAAYSLFQSNGIQIGITGIADPSIKRHTMKINTENMDFLNPEAALRKTAKVFSEKKADLKILLSYCHKNDLPVSKDTLSAAADILISPPSSDSAVQNTAADNVSQTAAASDSMTLYRVKFTYNRKLKKIEGHLRHDAITISPLHQKPDPEINEMITSYTGRVNKWLAEIIGKIAEPLAVENANCSAGNFTADIIRETGKCDIGLVDSKVFGKSISQGDITVKDVLDFIPGQNYIVALKTTGSELVKILKSLENKSGTLIFCSNLSYTAVMKESIVSEIKDILFNNAPIEPAKYYSVALPESLIETQDYTIENYVSLIYRSPLKKEIMDYIRINTPLQIISTENRIRITRL